MVIIKSSKCWQTLSSFPNSNFSDLEDSEVWIVDDESDIASRIKSLKSHWDPVLDSNGNLIDVVDNDPEYEERTRLEIEKKARIAELKKLLSDTDYIACKIAEGAAAREEYTEIIAQRQEWRDEINQLESGEQS